MKVPFNEEQTLAYLIDEENVELSWSNKLFGKTSVIYSTEELAKQYKKEIPEHDEIKTFTPYTHFIFLVFFAIFFLGIFIHELISQKKIDTMNKTFILLFLAFFICAVVGIIFDSTRNFKIILSKNGIEIKNISYKWDEIYELYIIRRPQARGYSYFLILALDTGLTDRYDFTNLMKFGATDKKIAAYIEYYKGLAANKVSDISTHI